MTQTPRQGDSAARKQKQLTPDDTIVPLIPGWARTYSQAVLIAAAGAIVSGGVIGLRDGASWGWALILAASVAAAGIWGWDYLRRVRGRQEELDRQLIEQSEFPLIDVMSGDEFEWYCTRVLPVLGYRNFVKIGGPNDGGVDILATDRDGIDVAIQCKRRKRSVGPWAVREVAGAVAGGRHAHRHPVLMTNALVTPRGRKAAEEAGVRLIARQELVHAIWQLKTKTHPETILDCSGDATPDSVGPDTPSKVLPETMVTLGIAACGTVTVLVVVLHAVLVPPRPAAAAPAVRVTETAPAAHLSNSASQPGPAEVVREYYAAISRHDWPSVWRLGGRNLGRGPYATYRGMVAGYADTIRDTLTAVHTSRHTVSGQFLAYQAGGVIVPYRFTFVVRNGVIISGHAK
jgi:hypothetical protein